MARPGGSTPAAGPAGPGGDSARPARDSELLVWTRTRSLSQVHRDSVTARPGVNGFPDSRRARAGAGSAWPLSLSAAWPTQCTEWPGHNPFKFPKPDENVALNCVRPHLMIASESDWSELSTPAGTVES